MTDDYESLKDEIVWRCVSMRSFSGGMSGFAHTEYVYNDRVLISHLGRYLEEITARSDVTKIKLERLGPLSEVWGMEDNPHPGTISFTKGIRKVRPLESFAHE